MKDDPLNRLKVKRGTALPHSKLDDDKVRLIRDAVREREVLKQQMANLSNASLAEYLGVHKRTVDRVTAFENWGHV
jgi:FixJ family two-component response regulator